MQIHSQTSALPVAKQVQLTGTIAGSLPWPNQHQQQLGNAVPIVWPQIESALQSFTAHRSDVDDSTIELRVPANVSGIWLAGMQWMQMRIIVPIVHDNASSEVMALNYTYLEWITVCAHFDSVAIGMRVTYRHTQFTDAQTEQHIPSDCLYRSH